MEKQYAPTNAEKKQPQKIKQSQQLSKQNTNVKSERGEEKQEEKKIDVVPDTTKGPEIRETKEKEQKQETKQEAKPQKVKKEEAIARGDSLSMSKKHGMYLCSFIKQKSVDTALAELEEVIKLKRAIPFKGEIPHRHNPGMMSGRYPVNASKCMIQVLKGLRGNILANGLSVDKAKIYWASASWASRPARRGGTRFKRAHIILKAKEFT